LGHFLVSEFEVDSLVMKERFRVHLLVVSFFSATHLAEQIPTVSLVQQLHAPTKAGPLFTYTSGGLSHAQPLA